MSDLGNKQVFARNLKWYLTEKGVTQIEVCQLLGIKPNTFSDWINAKTYPRIDKIEMLANYFGIEKSDLIENHDSSRFEESHAFFRLKEGLQPYNLSDTDVDFLLTVFQKHKESNS